MQTSSKLETSVEIQTEVYVTLQTLLEYLPTKNTDLTKKIDKLLQLLSVKLDARDDSLSRDSQAKIDGHDRSSTGLSSKDGNTGNAINGSVAGTVGGGRNNKTGYAEIRITPKVGSGKGGIGQQQRSNSGLMMGGGEAAKGG
jgi:hypothetical protein